MYSNVMYKKQKYVSIEELSDICAKLKKEEKTIVHCHGCFDLLHIGHIRYLKQAKEMGDILIVTITPDKYVDKGPYRPAFSQDLRAESIASLECVDYVAINQWPTAEETLLLLRPNIYVKGSDFNEVESDPTGKLQRERDVVIKIGAKLVLTKDIVFSSSHLINRYLPVIPERIKNLLETIKKDFSIDDIMKFIYRLSSLKVIIIGDIFIYDKVYCYSSNWISNSFTSDNSVTYIGGTILAANTIKNLVKEVKIIPSLLGENEIIEYGGKENLKKNSLTFSNISIKKQYIEKECHRILFDVIYKSDLSFPEKDKLQADMNKYLNEYDVILIIDMELGGVYKEIRSCIKNKSHFLGILANLHTLFKYDQADFITIYEYLPLEKFIEDFFKEKNYNYMLIKKNNDFFIKDNNSEFSEIPNMTHKSFELNFEEIFSLTALLAYLKLPSNLISFIGSVANFMIAEKQILNKQNFHKVVTSLLK